MLILIKYIILQRYIKLKKIRIKINLKKMEQLLTYDVTVIE